MEYLIAVAFLVTFWFAMVAADKLATYRSRRAYAYCPALVKAPTGWHDARMAAHCREVEATGHDTSTSWD